MNRNERKQMAEETLAIIERGGYEVAGRTIDIEHDIAEAIAGARLLRPDELKQMSRALPDRPLRDTEFSVVNQTTLETARRLAAEADQGAVFVLNFASAKNPGGGFLGGSQAQEESIARASALYPTLTACHEYYDVNRASRTAFYTDHAIYSPCVPVFRDDEGTLLEEPYLISVLTSPAVNAGAVRKNEPHRLSQVESAMRRRISYVLHVALSLGHEDLVLGAWGCGVFQNDPDVIAGLFAEQLLPGGLFAGRFRHVEFAVLDRSDRGIFASFQQRFSSTEVR